MATFNPEEWTPGLDDMKRPCWHHTVTRHRVILATGVAAEAQWKQAVAGAWKVYVTDGKDGNKPKTYWQNPILGETTWKNPDTNAPKPPPPPPQPKPAPDKNEREQDQWKHVVPKDGGRKYWKNTKTGKELWETPDCLKKYRQNPK